MATLSAPSAAVVPAKSPKEATRVEVKHTLTPERYQAENQTHDRILAGLAIFLGFWLASFPVTNSDVFRSLATGRMISEGRFVFGEDPFTYAAAEQARLNGELAPAWIHSSWFFDWLVFQVYSLMGGGGLVLLRGIVIALLAFVLLRIRSPRGSLAVSVACVSLGIVAVTAYLLLRSEILSLLFLALTLYWLDRPPVSPARPFAALLTRLTSYRYWILLPPMFALWANLDRWFFLGPMVVGLYWIGEMFQSAFRFGASNREAPALLTGKELGILTLVFVGGLLACCANPFGPAVFQNPLEFDTPAFRAFQEADPSYEGINPSPFTQRGGTGESPWYQPGGRTFAEWAYFPLLAIGLVSFALNYRRMRWERLLLWTAFAAFSAWTVRGVGFFAVMAAPIAALNFQEWLHTRKSGNAPAKVQPMSVALAQLGRIGLLALLLLTGALMIMPDNRETGVRVSVREPAVGLVHNGGSVGWSLRENLSLRESAVAMAQWRRDGALAGNALNFHRLVGIHALEHALPKTEPADLRQFQLAFLPPATRYRWSDMANYWAWFGSAKSPEGSNDSCKAFMDGRFRLSTMVVDDYLRACQGLCEVGLKPPYRTDPNSGAEPDQAWRTACRAADGSWQSVFRKYGVSHVVMGGQINGPFALLGGEGVTGKSLISILLDDRNENGEKQWALLKYDDGNTFIVAWKGSEAWQSNPRMRELEFDERGEVFGRSRSGKPYVGPTRPPPFGGPRRELRPSAWVSLLEGLGQRPPLALSRAEWHSQRAEAGHRIYGDFLSHLQVFNDIRFHRLGWAGAMVGLAINGGFPMPSLPSVPELDLERPFLAIHASRQAIADDPDGWVGYWYLWSSYRLLLRSHMLAFDMEHGGAPAKDMQINPFRELQMLYCLRQVALLNPDIGSMVPPEEDPNLLLARLYLQQRGCLDLAVMHFETFLDDQTRERPDRSVTAEEYRLKLRKDYARIVGRDIDALNRMVEEARKRAEAGGGTPLELAFKYIQVGLVNQGRAYLELLLQRHSPESREYAAAYRLLIDTYLKIGAVRETLQLLRFPDAEALLNPVVFNEVRGLASAAYGDYATALQCINDADDALRMESGNLGLAFQSQIRGGRPVPIGSMAGGALQTKLLLYGDGQDPGISTNRARRLSIAGIISLEAGKPQEAKEYFRRAIEELDENVRFRPLANRYYELITGKPLAWR